MLLFYAPRCPYHSTSSFGSAEGISSGSCSSQPVAVFSGRGCFNGGRVWVLDDHELLTSVSVLQLQMGAMQSTPLVKGRNG
jgi:hypothetical protein